MDSNGIDISPKDLDEQSSSSQSIGVEASVELDEKLVGEVSDANAFRKPEEDERTGTFVVGSKSKIEQLEYLRTNSDVSSTNGVDHQRSNSLQQSPVWEGTRLKGWSPSPQVPKGLDHCTTAPVGTHKSLFFESHEIPFSRSMIEKRENPRPEINLDRLSELEKKNLIVNLVKIQKDGTVEVDLTQSPNVASELLELRAVEVPPRNIDFITTELNKSVPKLKIAMLVVGTRGDVQPFLAVARRLQEFGHQVRLATHTNFSAFVKSAGVNFYPLGGDPRVLAGYMARNKGLIPSSPGEISIQRKQLKAIIESLLPACIEADIETGEPFRAQAIIANPPAYGHAHVAEALGVPLHIFFTMPWTVIPASILIEKLAWPCRAAFLIKRTRPTYAFPHPLARVPQSAGYWLSYIVVDLLVWWSIRGYINDFRRRKLKLDPIAYFSLYSGSIAHLPTAYMWSPQLVPKPSGNDENIYIGAQTLGPQVDVVGYCFLNGGLKYQPPTKFARWIQEGPPPIYIGFGSMPLEDPKKTTAIIVEALKITEQRGIIGRGWGDLGTLPEIPDSIFALEDCPHDWLFPQCLAVVHHGGAGTTATGLRAGCPTTIVPFFGDQFFWGDRIHEKGLGVAPIPISDLNVEALSDAIRFMLQPEVKSRAMEVAKLIENEDGVAAAVDAFHRHLPQEVPLPRPLPLENDHPNTIQWVFIQIGKICCLPCNS